MTNPADDSATAEDIQYLREKISDSEANGEDVDVASWGYEEGILLSRREASRLLRSLERAGCEAEPLNIRVGEEDDEIVVGDFHMERMSDGHIWFSVGGVSFDLTAVKKGVLQWTTQAASWDVLDAEIRKSAAPAQAEEANKT